MDRKTNAFWAALTILIVLAIHKAPSQAFLMPSKPANTTPPAVIWKIILLSA